MTDAEQEGPRNQPSIKSPDLQRLLDPNQATEFMNWLRQVVETSVCTGLAALKQEQSPVAKANGPEKASDVKVRGTDVSDAAKLRAADLRIALLLGKIPDSPGILIDAATTAKLLGISRSSFFKLLSMEAVPEPVLIGGKIGRWRLAELLEWIDAGCPTRSYWKYKGQGASQERAGR